jgi:hypothetical protein
VRFVREKWHWDGVFSDCFGFPLSVSFHHLLLHVAVTRKTNSRSLGTFRKAVLYWKSRTIEWKSTFGGFFFFSLEGLFSLYCSVKCTKCHRHAGWDVCQAGRYDLSVTRLVYPFYAANTWSRTYLQNKLYPSAQEVSVFVWFFHLFPFMWLRILIFSEKAYDVSAYWLTLSFIMFSIKFSGLIFLTFR